MTGSARAATLRFTDTTSLGALGGVLEYRPLAWLRFDVAPTLVRATSGATTVSGVGDLPLALEASTKLAAPLKPELAASLIATLPTGRAACGLGSGVANVGVELGAGTRAAASPGPSRFLPSTSRSRPGSTSMAMWISRHA
ncbi:MAG: hypothetical protein AUH81_03255 [Candidatus Rokubacteria bacterium 13_1_40CM_4_69_5]|nr:MAG: hypothetical protein AUH81_03255 [Candidatus Rokubacteria bacterium 13_1_40CM_4_69_5]